MKVSLVSRCAPPYPEGLFGDLYNASPSLLSQDLYKTNKAWPDPTLEKRIREGALNVRTVQEYVKMKVADFIEHRRQHEDTEFTADVDVEMNLYLAELDPKRVERFNQIVEEIRAIASQEAMNILQLKQLAAEQHQLIYGVKDQHYRRNLGLA